jgi:hypothetical protein
LLKYLYNPATDEFESLTPTLRERFALGGGVIQGEKVGDRENFAEPTSYPTKDYILKKLEKGYDIGEIVRDFAKDNNIDIFGGTRTKVPTARRNLNASVRRTIFGNPDGSGLGPDKELVSLLENNIKNSNPDVVQKQFTDFVNKNKDKYLNKKGGTEKLYEDAVKWFKKNNPAGLLTYDGTQVRTLRPNQEVIRLKSGEGSIETSYKRGRQEIREIVSPSEGVGPSKQKSKYARLDEAWEMAADSLNMSTKDYKNLLQKYITRPAQRIIPELTGTKYAAGPEHIYGLRQAIGTSLKKEMIKSATNVSPAPREFNSFIKGPQLDQKVTGMIDNAFNTNDIGKRRKIIESANNEINLFAKKFPGTYPKYVVDKVGNIKDVNLNKINLKAKKTTDIGTEYIDYLLKTPGFTKSKEYKNLPKESKDLIDTRKSGNLKKFEELIKSKVNSLRKQGVTLFSKLERGSPARKILESIPGAPGKVVDAAVITPFDFFSSIAAGYNLPESAAIAASNLLPKSVQKVLPATLATYDTQREMTDKFEPVFNLSDGEETKFGKKIREGVGEAIDKIKDRFGDDSIGTADDVPEPESAERKRMFDDANERFNEMEISDVDDQFMAAAGGRVGFEDGSPDPFVDQALSALNNTKVYDLLKEQNKQTLREQIYGDDGDRTLMQTFNTMFADPKAYPYYAQELASGAANIPELAFRFPFAVTGLVSDVATGKGDKLKRAMETLDPKLTKAIKEKIGFTDMLEKSRTERTEPQKTTGGILELGAEIPGPATPYFLIKAFPKIANQIKNLVGTGTAAEKVNKEIENKMATQGVDQTRRDILLATGAGGAMALLKYLGLDNLIKTTKVAKAAPEIVTKGGTPKYFFDFVNLIKSKGDDITETAATVERQKVYDYNGYTMYEDMTTGKISIRKDTEGGATYSIGDGEYETVDGIIRKEEINYEPSETILNEKGKPVKVPDQYDEATVRPDEDGGEGDFEVGLDSIDDILELLSKDGKTYSKEELLKMGIDADALGNYPTGAGSIPEGRAGDANPFKPKKAGGGIMKMAGDDSGPPPKSGPTPHGLPYIAKNVRPIKERK